MPGHRERDGTQIEDVNVEPIIERDAPVVETAGLRERLLGEADRVCAENKERAVVARLLSVLAKPKVFENPVRLDATLKKALAKIPAGADGRCGVDRILDEVRQHVALAPDRVRRELGRELKRECEARGLGFRVVSKEDPVEVRIPPFAVVMDFKAARAGLRFAREEVESAPARADAIVAAHAKAQKALDAGFDPKVFFKRCLVAYRQALAAEARADGDRVELLAFLPLLALQMQPKRFLAHPTREGFRPYGRALFAYHVWKLREANGLSQDGRRLNLGVATGVSASDKDRVVYLEDPEGTGEYKLTVFFTRVEGEV